MQSQLSREEARRETSRKWLRDAANDIIPFVILRRHLIQLRAQIIAEEQQQTAHAFITELNTPSTHRKLLELFSVPFLRLWTKTISVILENKKPSVISWQSDWNRRNDYAGKNGSFF